MGEIQRKLLEEIRENIQEKFSKEMIEDLYGITFKRNPKKENESETYNLYNKETGELLIPCMHSWDIQSLFEWIGCHFANVLYKNSEKEDDEENALRLSSEIAKEQKTYEEKYYKTCGVCGFRYDSQTTDHFHV